MINLFKIGVNVCDFLGIMKVIKIYFFNFRYEWILYCICKKYEIYLYGEFFVNSFDFGRDGNSIF